MKRGQLDTVLTNIPVFILVLVIMAVFVLLVSLLGAIRPDSSQQVSSNSEGNLIYKRVVFQDKERLFLEVIKENRIFFSPEREEMIEVLKGFLDKDRDCIAMFKSLGPYSEDRDLGNELGGLFLGYYDEEGRVDYYDDSRVIFTYKDEFGWPEKFSQFYYKQGDEDIFVHYYFGKCLEVKNE